MSIIIGFMDSWVRDNARTGLLPSNYKERALNLTKCCYQRFKLTISFNQPLVTVITLWLNLSYFKLILSRATKVQGLGLIVAKILYYYYHILKKKKTGIGVSISFIICNDAIVIIELDICEVKCQF